MLGTMENRVQTSFVNSDVAASDKSSQELVVSYSAYGVRVGLETTEALARYLPAPLIPGGEADYSIDSSPVIFGFTETPSSDGRTEFVVSENGGQLASSTDVEIAAHTLESRVHQYVAANAQQVVFVHAGVVSWKGKAVLLPGRSRSGKSTMVMGLVNAGATYYSDEYAVIDASGYVHPFQRPLRLRSDVTRTGSFAGNWTYDADLPPLPVGLVLCTKFDQTGVWQPRLLTEGETLLALLQNTVAVRRQAELSIRALKNAVASATGLESDRGDAGHATQHIVRSIDQSTIEDR
jgi:hypothetical protein